MEKGKRLESVDFIKGVGIALVVYGHSGAPFKEYIYLFHMAIFFMATGYLWNVKKVGSIQYFCKYFKDKLKKLYVPFLLGNGIYTLFNNIFIEVGIYIDDSSSFALEGGYLRQSLSATDTVRQLLKNLLFSGDIGMGGATWFFRVMFVSCIILWILQFAINKAPVGRMRKGIFIGINIILISGSWLVSCGWLNLHWGMNACFASLSCIELGILMQKVDFVAKVTVSAKFIFWGMFVLLLILNGFGTISLGQGEIVNPFFLCITSVAGFVMLMALYKIVAEPVRRAFGYLGRNTVPIILLHFLAFKVVSYLFIVLHNEDRVLLAQFPVLKKGALWICYVAVGLFLPLICNGIAKRVSKIMVHVRK